MNAIYIHCAGEMLALWINWELQSLLEKDLAKEGEGGGGGVKERESRDMENMQARDTKVPNNNIKEEWQLRKKLRSERVSSTKNTNSAINFSLSCCSKPVIHLQNTNWDIL